METGEYGWLKYKLFLKLIQFKFSHTQCSCTGYTKRRVQCFDGKMNRQTNHCLDKDKPQEKKRCDQPATCKCQKKMIFCDFDQNLNGFLHRYMQRIAKAKTDNNRWRLLFDCTWTKSVTLLPSNEYN